MQNTLSYHKHVLIAGRPNVGKSTLFNRLVGKKIALTGKTAGLTRDRREEIIEYNHYHIMISDTAGLEHAKKNSLNDRMTENTLKAIKNADLIFLLIDAKVGITLDDQEYAQKIRKMNKKIILVANKAENKKSQTNINDATIVGLGNPIAISAEHAIGLNQIYDAIDEICKQNSQSEKNQKYQNIENTHTDNNQILKLALVGRPNTGKSTLLNHMIGQERLLTGPEAGITRDAITIPWRWEKQKINLIDTAGMRKKSKISKTDEISAVEDTINAIKYADICIILINPIQPFEKQDVQIAEMVAKQGCGIVFALNKWDLISQYDKKDMLQKIIQHADAALPQIRGTAIIPISAILGHGCKELMHHVIIAHKQREKRISTAKLNQWFGQTILKHPPPAPKGKRIKMRYITQAKANPPTFIIFCQRAKEVPNHYRRYLENRLREEFNFQNTPVRLYLRQGENPYIT